MTPIRAWALSLAALLAAAGCGKSKEAQAFDQIEAECLQAPANHETVNDLAQRWNAGSGFPKVIPLGCNGTMQSIAGAACGPVDADHPECATYFEWLPSDPGLCSTTTGYCCILCEVRQAATAGQTAPDPGAASCGARFLTGMPCY